jgi:membrane protein
MTAATAPTPPQPSLLDRLPAPLATFLRLLQQTFQEWNEDNVPRLAAALSYYTAFSIAPLLVVIIAVAGLIIGARGAQDEIVGSISAELGPEVASLIEGAIANATRPNQSITSTLLGLLGLLLGAIGVFEQLKNALNTIWGVQAPAPSRPGLLGTVITFVTSKLLSFSMILVVGFLLLVSLVLSAVLAGVAAEIVRRIPAAAFALQFVTFAVSFIVTTVLMALIYKFLPDTEIQWRDVWVGAAFTSLLFSIGRFALSQYLANSGTASVYGAAGSLALVLLWVYYSAQILLFGAEFTQVYANRKGSRAAAPMNRASEQLKAIADAAPAIDRRVAAVQRAAQTDLPLADPAARKGGGLGRIIALLAIMAGALAVGLSAPRGERGSQ